MSQKFIEYNGEQIPVIDQYADADDVIAESYLPEQYTPKKSRITIMKMLGVATVGFAVLAPPTAHWIAESVTTAATNILPGQDYELTLEDAVQDFGKSLIQIIPRGGK